MWRVVRLFRVGAFLLFSLGFLVFSRCLVFAFGFGMGLGLSYVWCWGGMYSRAAVGSLCLCLCLCLRACYVCMYPSDTHVVLMRMSRHCCPSPLPSLLPLASGCPCCTLPCSNDTSLRTVPLSPPSPTCAPQPCSVTQPVCSFVSLFCWHRHR